MHFRWPQNSSALFKCNQAANNDLGFQWPAWQQMLRVLPWKTSGSSAMSGQKQKTVPETHRLQSARCITQTGWQHCTWAAPHTCTNHTQMSDCWESTLNPLSTGTQLEHTLKDLILTANRGRQNTGFGESTKSSTSTAAACNVSIGKFSIRPSKLNNAHAKSNL